MLVEGLIALVLLAFASGNGTTGPKKYCLSEDPKPYDQFSTKTSYFKIQTTPLETLPLIDKGCTPKSVWMLMNHGSQHPDKDTLKLMSEKAKELQKRIFFNSYILEEDILCAKDLELIRLWELDVTEDQSGQLAGSGKTEMKELAKRVKALNKHLGDYTSGDNFVFRPTALKVTQDSIKAFVEGMFPEDLVLIQNPLEQDPVLMYSSQCPKWTQMIKENQATYQEQVAFEGSEEIRGLVDRVNIRLGIQGSTDMGPELGVFEKLTLDDIKLIYDLCRFEVSRSPKMVSPWCAAFMEEDLKALELHEDLKFWALNGYGNPLNSDMACPLINDLVDTFVNISSDGTKGVFYVSDSDAFLPFLSLLGLFNDSQPLIGPNYNNSLKDRAYRTSTMSPFAANIAFVFFDCDEHEDKVVVLHNETPVKLEACSTPHCTWSQFKAIFQDHIGCDFKERCSIPAGGGGSWLKSSTSLNWILSVLIGLSFLHMFI